MEMDTSAVLHDRLPIKISLYVVAMTASKPACKDLVSHVTFMYSAQHYTSARVN